MQHLDGAVLCDEVFSHWGVVRPRLRRCVGTPSPHFQGSPCSHPYQWSSLHCLLLSFGLRGPPQCVPLPLWPECRSAQQTAWWPMGHRESKAGNPRGRLCGLKGRALPTSPLIISMTDSKTLTGSCEEERTALTKHQRPEPILSTETGLGPSRCVSSANLPRTC